MKKQIMEGKIYSGVRNMCKVENMNHYIRIVIFVVTLGMLLSGCNRSVWKSLQPDEQEPGLWKGDKYDAWFEITESPVINEDHFGGQRYYGEIAINGMVYSMYVSFIPYYVIYLDATKFDEGILDSVYPILFQANETKSYKDGSFSSTVTLDKDNLFKGDLPTIKFNKVS